MHINETLKELVDRGGSDLHLKVGSPPIIRVDGRLMALQGDRLSVDELYQMLYGILSDKQKVEFESSHELDFAYGVRGLARFRVNLSMQRGTPRAVMRIVPFEVANFDQLGLPSKALIYLCNQTRGLVLITGPTGSGKSTTLAAMVDYINNHRSCHIVTIEDPIEFLYRDNKCIISQREVGADTDSFSEALRHVLRQDPDVILIGEMRDMETIGTALTAAETGHLVLSTLHTSDAASTIDRIIDVHPPHQQNQIRIQLAYSLQGVLSQKIVPRKDTRGRLPACEVLIATPTIRKVIGEGGSHSELYQQILAGKFYDMRTMNLSLVELFQSEKITMEEALLASPNPDEFRLNLKGIYSGSGTVDAVNANDPGQQRVGLRSNKFENG